MVSKGSYLKKELWFRERARNHKITAIYWKDENKIEI